MINPDFFLLTADSLGSLALELVFGISYLFTLLITIIFLALRYFLVAVGLIFFPFGIFFYFIPFMKSYGKLIINTLMIMIFLPFFQSLILLVVSKMLEVSVFAEFKILVLITSFLLINLVTIFMLVFAIVKSAFALMNTDMGRAAKLAIGKVK